MIPPVDPSILERNPNFDVLYKDLITRKLNPDGSTRDTKKQRIHDEIRRSLTTARTNLITNQILINSLSDLPSRASELPPELHAVIEIVSAQLRCQIPETDREILSGDIEFFHENISAISSVLTVQLTTIIEYLAKISNPKSPPAISELPSEASSLHQRATQSLPQELSEARTQLANSAASYLNTHRQHLEASIRIMEQTQHGALARHTKSTAELLHARSTLLGLQAKIHTFSHPPPAEFVAALKEFKKQQGTGERALKDREALARRELQLYDRAGERALRDLAKRKGHLSAELERTEGEIQKLEHRE